MRARCIAFAAHCSRPPSSVHPEECTLDSCGNKLQCSVSVIALGKLQPISLGLLLPLTDSAIIADRRGWVASSRLSFHIPSSFVARRLGVHLSSTLGACSVQYIPLAYSQSSAAILVSLLLFSSGACSSTCGSDRTFPSLCLVASIGSVLCF